MRRSRRGSRARGVAFLGGDVALDVVPSQVEGVALPIHTLLIAGLGINLLDNQDLEARRRNRARSSIGGSSCSRSRRCR